MPNIDVIRYARLQPGSSTPGIVRENAFEGPGLAVARSRVAGGVTSAWHHHGERELYGFVSVGRLRLEYGPNGDRAVDLDTGDFFHIPPRLVHRDVNPSWDHETLIVQVLAGEGAKVVNVDGPGP